MTAQGIPQPLTGGACVDPLDDIPALQRKWEAAQRAWNRDGGPIEKTVKAGEDLYFAASFLIEALQVHRATSEAAA